ncbi:MAG: hypothetical protein M1821_007015 [Bathelium mastoideum]|nr:MAG: hypothetical protein M1821_007015 [Bathelium mastoideum]
MSQAQEHSAESKERVPIRHSASSELHGDTQLEPAVRAPKPTFWGSYDNVERRQKLKKVFLSSDTDENTEETFWDAERERERMVAAFAEFQETLPEYKEKTLRNLWGKRISTREKVDQQLKSLNIVEMKDVEQAVRNCQEDWSKKDRLLGGKDGFHRVCKSFNSYSGIFALFPSDNEYVSILCASLKLIVESSARHMKTAEQFLESLEKALNSVDDVMIYGGLMDITSMKQLISKLYAKIFEFLRFAMQWWASNSLSKTGDALGTGLIEELQKKTGAIEGLCQQISQKAVALGLAESRYSRLVGEENNSMLRQLMRRDSYVHKLSDSQLRLTRELEAERQKYKTLEERQRNYEEAVHQQVLSLNDPALSALRTWTFEGNVRIFLFNQNSIDQSLRTVKELTPGVEDEASTHTGDLNIAGEQANEIGSNILLQENALNIVDSLDHCIIGSRNIQAPYKYDKFSAKILSELHTWSLENSSQVLWIIGKPDYLLPSNMSAAACATIATAEKLDIPIVSHFCQLPSSGDRREEAGLIGLLYNLIMQLLEHLPPKIDTHEVPLSQERLAKLDGTMNTWYEALDLFEDLLKHNPWPLLLCVIDGLTRLDFGVSTPRCEEVIYSLTKHFKTSERIFKVLLTSSGNTGTDTGLGRQIPMGNRVYARDGDEHILDLTGPLLLGQ